MASRLVTWACSGASGSSAGGGHGVEQDVEQRARGPGTSGSVAVGGAVAGRAARAAGGVDDRQVEQLGGVVLVEVQLVGQLEEELEALVDDLGDAGVRRGRSC